MSEFKQHYDGIGVMEGWSAYVEQENPGDDYFVVIENRQGKTMQATFTPHQWRNGKPGWAHTANSVMKPVRKEQ